MKKSERTAYPLWYNLVLGVALIGTLLYNTLAGLEWRPGQERIIMRMETNGGVVEIRTGPAKADSNQFHGDSLRQFLQPPPR